MIKKEEKLIITHLKYSTHTQKYTNTSKNLVLKPTVVVLFHFLSFFTLNRSHKQDMLAFFFFAFPNHQKLLFQLTICNDNKFFPNDWPSSPTVNISHLNQPIIGPQIKQTRQHTDLPVCSLRQGAYKLRQNSIPSQENVHSKLNLLYTHPKSPP